ncbi:hypothetical protein LXA43DRAFT_1013850 [Ganoderma leucocontextum]|nr:hypothetical protein LXA43DRAFT_1013850 [Ganoderma leucocontextum]
MSSLTVFALILPSLFLPSPVYSVLVNRTIDDESGDSETGLKPVYGPDDSSWNQGSTCSGCHITPFIDKTQPFDGTWHDGTYSPGGPDLTISLSFTGTAVYVFNIIPNTLESTDTLANITFSLDGDHVGTYLHIPDATSNFLYRVPVYTNATLANKLHSLEMRASGTNASLILFDYVIYSAEQSDISSGTNPSSTSSLSSSATSTPSSTPSSSHSPPVGAIVGGTVGGVAAIAILAALAFFLSRRGSHKARPPTAHLDIKPFVEGSDAVVYGGGAGYHGSEYGGSGSGGGSGYGGALGNTASGYGMTGHARGPSDSPSTPFFLANPDPSIPSLPHSFGKGELLPLSERTQSPHAVGLGSTLARRETAASRHQAELTERIRALEDQMRGIASPAGTAAHLSPRPSRPSSGDAVARALQSELAALRGEVAGLNAQLAEERMMAESLPPYWQDPSSP